MRVSTLYKAQATVQEPERMPVVRLVVWSVMALVLLGGVALFFLFGRGVTPLL